MILADNEWIYIILSTFPLLLCLFGILSIIYMSRNHKYWKRKGIPYIKPKWFFGNAFDVLTMKLSVAEFFWQIHENSEDDYVGIYILDQPCLLIRDPELVKDIFAKNPHIFPNRTGFANPVTDPISHNVLFVATAPNSVTQRKTAGPLYSSSKLRTQMSNFPDISHGMIQYIKKKIATDGNLFNTKDITNRYTVQIIVKAFYGITEDTFGKTDSPFMWLTQKVFNWNSKFIAFMVMCTFLAPQWAQVFGLKFIDDSASKFFKELTLKLIKDREEANIQNYDLVDLLIDIKKKNNITDLSSFEANCLVARVFEVFAAGYETTSTALTQTLFELAKNPKCQSLARKDIQDNIKKYGEITYESLHSMEYLGRCYQESLRLHPISLFLDRRSIEKYQIPGTDIILDKGQGIYISPRGFHRDPKYYPNPSQFDPERFTEENIKKRPEHAYMPFGFGQRHCPGKRFATQHALSGLAHILSNFEVKLPEGAPRTFNLHKGGITAQPVEDLNLEFIEI